MNPYSFYKKYISYRYKHISYCLIISSIFSYICLLSWILFFSPDDILQGQLVKIMYIHVPSAWISMLAYISMGICAILYLSYKSPFFDALTHVINIIAWQTTATALITGSIWGKAAWGTWWVWDARLTSMLMQLMILSFCLLFRTNRRNSQASSVFAIVGLINIPIIKFSVNTWNTLHQPSSILSKNGIAIDNSMLYPMLLSFVLMIVFYLGIALLLLEQQLRKRRYRD